jgi:hypothetical protein
MTSNSFSMPKQSMTLHERGILLTTLQYSMREANGTISCRQALLATNMPISPKLQALYDETLKFSRLVRDQLRPGDDAHFVLFNPDDRVIGCITLDMSDLSDRDIAWINCLFAESEGAVLAFFGSMPNAAENHNSSN